LFALKDQKRGKKKKEGTTGRHKLLLHLIQKQGPMNAVGACISLPLDSFFRLDDDEAKHTRKATKRKKNRNPASLVATVFGPRKKERISGLGPRQTTLRIFFICYFF
jgi:hypothetical protein